MIRVTPQLAIDEGDVRVDFIRSSGPGGQNVNKVATAAQLRFDVLGCRTLSDPVRRRLMQQAANRINSEGVLIIDARRHRSQRMNQADAMDRLLDLLRRAATVPKPRRATRPTAGSRQRRLESKRRRSEVKGLRRQPEEQAMDVG